MTPVEPAAAREDAATPDPVADLATARNGAARTDPAFTLLYQASYPRLVAQMTPVTGSVTEAEDVVQEAFVRAAERWPHIAAYEDPEGWVRRVALNLAISAVRRTVRAAAVWTRLVSGLGRTLSHPGVEASQIDRLHLLQALRELPVKYRTVLALHHLLDQDVETIAATLRISPNTVKTRLARGRARLRASLGQHGSDQSVDAEP